ncbi:hypothetical protein [Roseospirillum parvum]|uniref:PAS fold-containing protein n=1 Tax=Roseospirillum parvum TaxID=83401 RepID=A0A1G8DNU5_9PROT|nr:hypothetical protein [Roseospirillum parvum]SDH59337.1 hypothetical protein SAMN05421742_10872 [Roseospirillum parvum]
MDGSAQQPIGRDDTPDRRTAGRALSWWQKTAHLPTVTVDATAISRNNPSHSIRPREAFQAALPSLGDLQALYDRDAALSHDCYVVRLADGGMDHVIEHGGASLEAAFGEAVVGRPLPEVLPGEFARQLSGFMDAARQYGRPVADCAVFTDLDEGRLVYYRNLLLPFRTDPEGPPPAHGADGRSGPGMPSLPSHLVGVFSFRCL